MNRKVGKNGFFYAIAQGMLFGLVHVLIQSAVRGTAVSNETGLLIRFLVSSVVLLPAALRRIKQAALSKKLLWKTALASLGMLVTTLLLYASYRYISTGMGVTLHYTYPIVTMVISVLFFRVKLNWQMLLSITLSFAGIVFLCDMDTMGVSAALGAALALASAVTFSCYLLWTEHQNLNSLDPIVLTALISLFNSLGLLVYGGVRGSFSLALSPRSAVLLCAGGLVGVLAMLALTLAIQRAGAVYTSILGTLEPITSTVGGALILHETVRGPAVLGSALVVIAVVVATLSGRSKGQKESAAY